MREPTAAAWCLCFLCERCVRWKKVQMVVDVDAQANSHSLVPVFFV